MKQNKIKSHAKINLALNITGKTSFLHKIESIVTFVSLHDIIFIKKIKSKSHNITFTGKFSKNIKKNNTVSKLLEILEKKKLLKNINFRIKINKQIPNRAGLGGGSMNAANILKYFILLLSVLLILTVYLSTVGLETDKFNDQIKKKLH